MLRKLNLHNRTNTPLELIKDQSIFRVRLTAWVMCGGQLFYYCVWAKLYPQMYENLTMRLLAAIASIVLLLLSYRWKVNSLRLELTYCISVFFGSVFLATWYFFANNASTVWVSSYCVIIALYFTSTDWRVAIAGILASVILTLGALPLVHPEIWAQLEPKAFTGPTIFITTFAITASLFTHFMDKNIKTIQLANQKKALGIAAHEVRTPLASIGVLNDALLSRLNDLKSDSVVNATTISSLKDLALDIGKSVALTSGIISTHLVNANPMRQFQWRIPIKISVAAQEAIDLFVFLGNLTSDTVNLRIEHDFYVEADPTIIQQVLRNLLDNAHCANLKRHSPPSSRTIVVILDSNGEQGTITVQDNGVGISRKHLKKIFEPFYTTNNDSGHGLGLTFVRAAVVAYGGTIRVLSNVNEGASFIINLPIPKTK